MYSTYDRYDAHQKGTWVVIRRGAPPGPRAVGPGAARPRDENAHRTPAVVVSLGC